MVVELVCCADSDHGLFDRPCGLKKAEANGGTLQYVPDGTMTPRNFFELFTGALFGLADDLLGDKNAKKFFWIVGGLFIYILTSNLLGVVPGMLPPSGSLHHNFAMALVVLFLFNGAGIKAQGLFGYLKHMWGPVWWLGVLLFFIELLSFLVVRPYSLSLRLTGNMFGDHQVLSIMSGLIPVVYPVIFLSVLEYSFRLSRPLFSPFCPRFTSRQPSNTTITVPPFGVKHDEVHHNSCGLHGPVPFLRRCYGCRRLYD